MKAHINGITLEGTPQEIMEYQQLQAEQAEKPIAEFPDYQPWFGIFPPYHPGTGTADVPYWLKYPVIITCNITEE